MKSISYNNYGRLWACLLENYADGEIVNDLKYSMIMPDFNCEILCTTCQLEQLA